MPTAHWEAGNRPCKRDKIKWDSSCSNSSQISGSKLQRSTCFNSHCRYLLLCGFRGCSCEGCWALGGKEEQRVLSRERQIWEWIREILSPCFVQHNISDCCSDETGRWRGMQWMWLCGSDTGRCLGGKGIAPSWRGLWPLWGSQAFVGCFLVMFHTWLPRSWH